MFTSSAVTVAMDALDRNEIAREDSLGKSSRNAVRKASAKPPYVLPSLINCRPYDSSIREDRRPIVCMVNELG